MSLFQIEKTKESRLAKTVGGGKQVGVILISTASKELFLKKIYIIYTRKKIYMTWQIADKYIQYFPEKLIDYIDVRFANKFFVIRIYNVSLV